MATVLNPTRVASFIDRQKAAMIVGYVDLTLTDNYPTAGWELTKAQVNPNITTVYSYSIEFAVDGGTPIVHFLKWDHANGKLIAYMSTTGQQCADSYDDMSGSVVRLRYEAI